MNQEVITLAGGCFWCTQGLYDQQEGVIEVVSGYAGGTIPDPSYEQVSTGSTQYKEAVQITYDSETTSLKQLLELFMQNIDPTDAGGQFADRGEQYTTAIYYHTEKQQEVAQAVCKQLAEKYEKPIATEILPYTTFYPAEKYHQNFHKKNPLRYKQYVRYSGRDTSHSGL